MTRLLTKTIAIVAVLCLIQITSSLGRTSDQQPQGTLPQAQVQESPQLHILPLNPASSQSQPLVSSPSSPSDQATPLAPVTSNQSQPMPVAPLQEAQTSAKEEEVAHPQAKEKEQLIENASQSSPDIQRIVDKGELVVAMYSIDQPPFFMTDKDGKLIGFDVELAEKMADSLGVRLRFNRSANSFNDVIDTVASGKADIGISKLSYTLPRAKKVLYSKPYMMLKKTFLINRLKMAKAKGKREADTLQKLIDHHEGTIGVIANSSYINYAKQLFPKTTIVPLASWGLESLDMAMQGKILAIFRDDLEILKLIRRVPDSNFHVLPVTLKNQIDPIHMVVPWNKTHFLEWINGFLETVKINLSVDELLNQYEAYFKWTNQADNLLSLNDSLSPSEKEKG